MADNALILASGSPRRRQLLELIGLRFTIEPPEVDETPLAGEEPTTFVRRAARDKAAEVAARRPGALVLGADTVVEIDGRILGKPSSPNEAADMLRRLSGRTHLVHTAIALAKDGTTHDLIDSAEVRFVDIDDDIIRWYVATGEPMDKAGAYAVQGQGGILVAGVEGSPHTVVGLPVHRIPELYTAHDLDFWSRVEGT